MARKTTKELATRSSRKNLVKGAVKISLPTEIITRRVKLCGTQDIMFDRYAGDNDTKLEPHQKLYFQPGNSKVIGIPALNIMSFLSAHNTNSAPKRLRDSRKFKKICDACLSYVTIEPSFIPLFREGKPIVFGAFNKEDYDETGKIYVHRSVARLAKGVPNKKIRPTVEVPWEITFTFILRPNREIQETEIQNLFEEGGQAIGLGTFRGVFGKFRVEKWDEVF